ncbi:MAG: AsmA-like C-terminal region-containing protein, partial [Bacteroidota bacterium]|nr:AsmA-like C-terminal region-containing protein [Bacteroidota bacterium]
DGDIYFKGTISGKTDRGIPNIECQFGIKDMRMLIPESGLYIENGELIGFFRSGLKTDLSDAFLRIDTLEASLPDGHIIGSFSIRNFEQPYLNYQLDLKTNLSGFDDVFNLKNIDDLNGLIHFKDTYAGYFSSDSGWTISKSHPASIIFDRVSFNIPGLIELNHIHGYMTGNIDSIEITDLDIRTGNSDILVNGNLFGISQLILDSKQNITADLRIVSKNFDLPGTLSFLPRLKWTFPYQIKNIDLDVLIGTSKIALTEFNRTPEINFKIKHLEGTLENLINPARITNGSFTLGEIDSILNLKFDDFDIKIGESELQADVKLSIPPARHLELDLNVLAENLNPGKVLFHESSDSFPDFFYNRIDGDIKANLFFFKDTASILTSLDYSSSKLAYTGISDTIDIETLHLRMEREQNKNQQGTNPLAILTANIKLEAQSVNSRHFMVDDVEYQIDADEGIYTIIPLQSRFFGKPGTGTFIIAPFAKPLWGHIEYAVEQFQIEYLLSTFREDPALSGPMDFNIVMDFQGSNLDTILSTMNADIQIKAKDLSLKGLDIDKFINKFQRSQHFNLVDVGAVLIAGPVGLAVTKGSDFALVFVHNQDEFSKITELISNNSIKDGQLELSDVAFATEKNRIAVKGWYNTISDSLDITIGVVNPKGCEILSQQVYGHLKSPELGSVKIISKLFAPVSNIFKDKSGDDCDPFYTGKLKHPEPIE